MIDWACVKAEKQGRKANAACRKATLESSRKAWVNQQGKPQSESDRYFLKVGILSFYEDYLCSNDNLADYLASI